MGRYRLSAPFERGANPGQTHLIFEPRRREEREGKIENRKDVCIVERKRAIVNQAAFHC